MESVYFCEDKGSKGMANYETMSEYDFKPIAYLLKTKCESVAEAMGLSRNMNVARVERQWV